MNREINITEFKDASYFSERRVASTDVNYCLKSRKRKEYWDKFIGEGAEEFWEYLKEKNGFSNQDLNIFLEENEYDVEEIDSFLYMNKFIKFYFENNDYPLPDFYIIDSKGKRKPIFSKFVIPFLKFGAYNLEGDLNSDKL